MKRTLISNINNEELDYSFEEYKILKKEAIDNSNVFYQHLQIFASILASVILLLNVTENQGLLINFWFFAIGQFFLYIFLLIQANHVIYLLLIRNYLAKLEKRFKQRNPSNYPKWESEYATKNVFSLKSSNTHSQILISIIYVFIYLLFMYISWIKLEDQNQIIPIYYICIMIFELISLLYLAIRILIKTVIKKR